MKHLDVSVKSLLIAWVVFGTIVTIGFAALSVNTTQKLSDSASKLLSTVIPIQANNHSAAVVISSYIERQGQILSASTRAELEAIPSAEELNHQFSKVSEEYRVSFQDDGSLLGRLDDLVSSHRQYIESDRQLRTVVAEIIRLDELSDEKDIAVEKRIGAVKKYMGKLAKAAKKVEISTGVDETGKPITQSLYTEIVESLNLIEGGMLSVQVLGLGVKSEKEISKLKGERSEIISSGFDAIKKNVTALAAVEMPDKKLAKFVKKIDRGIGKFQQSLFQDNDSLVLISVKLLEKKSELVAIKQKVTNDKQAMLDVVNGIAELTKEVEKNTAAKTSGIVKKNKILLISAGVILGLFWIGAGAFLIRRITGPLDHVGNVMESISKGDLNVHIDSNIHDEFGRLLEKVQDTIHRLDTMLIRISEASRRINETTRMVLESSDQAVVGAHKQITAGKRVIDTITSMVTHAEYSQKNAHQAMEVADSSSESVKRGVVIVKQSVAEISKLSNNVNDAGDIIADLKIKSDNISVVLDVIRSIADQTNLLALNAAIEAARAGENGRGFAVVADEVRSLAKKTQDSTGEIQELIESIQDRADSAVSAMDIGRETSRTSVDKIHGAGEILVEIEKNISGIQKSNNQIEGSANDQVDLAKRVHGNILLMEHVLVHTCVDIERINDANRHLDEVARELSVLTTKFSDHRIQR